MKTIGCMHEREGRNKGGREGSRGGQYEGSWRELLIGREGYGGDRGEGGGKKGGRGTQGERNEEKGR